MDQEFDLAHHFHPISLFIHAVFPNTCVVKQKRCIGLLYFRQYICISQNFIIANIQSTCTVTYKHICQQMPIYINAQDTPGHREHHRLK